MIQQLNRITAESSRAAEYFSVRELQAQTGQPVENFATVILKELLDNALDEAEKSGVPEIYIEITETPDYYFLSVQDNGAGFPEEAIDGIINFNIKLSSKSIYSAPTRGAQGNALKTVLGIPFALGCREQLIIESQGKLYMIAAWVDPAGLVQSRKDVTENSRIKTGSKMIVTIPKEGQQFDPEYLTRAFALFNPHAFIKLVLKQSNDKQAKFSIVVQEKIYKPLTKSINKQSVLDLTSPWWYSIEGMEKLIFAHIASSKKSGKDKPLGEFVREFKGLTSTRKAKLVTGELKAVNRLSDFEPRPELISLLLKTMQFNTKPPSANILGIVGEANFKSRFKDYFDCDRFWYAKFAEVFEGIPFVFEVALAEVNNETGGIYYGINFSSTFGDPLTSTLLKSKDFYSFNLKDYFNNSCCHVEKNENCGNKNVAVAIHLISPVLQFMDRGKSRIKLDRRISKYISSCLEKVTKTLYREEKSRCRDAAKAERRRSHQLRQELDPKTIKESVFYILPEAIKKATGDGICPVSARSLYYQVRSLIQRYTRKNLDYNYFSQSLLTEYQKEHGLIELLYFDPRGYLYEPHTSRTIPLGTIEVKEYQWPEWVFDKILYVEKKGLIPTLQAAKLAERYDMAIVAAEGFATEATRVLLKKASRDRNYKLFVLHDADPAGYEIARTLQEETRRMPGYSVEVIDLGLKVREALKMGLEAETFTRKKSLPSGVSLTPEERKFFTGKQHTSNTWVAERIELNAMTGPALVSFIEMKLREAGATEKVLPPDQVIVNLANQEYLRGLDQLLTQEIIQRLDISEMVRTIINSQELPDFNLSAKTRMSLQSNSPQSWCELVLEEVETAVEKTVSNIDWDIMERNFTR